ncbi:XRE family transcriptional regulator [Citreimonas sp.]|uniref:XRE family transcriptional regulator n=1 Tax=Citreimonas sp. TaxID=3036715 RepID=UPI0040596A34
MDQAEKFVAGLKVVMDKRGLKPAPLSEQAGLGTSFIRDLIRSKAQSPKLSTALQIAGALNLSVDAIISAADNSPEANTISIAGKVGAGAHVPVFDAYEKGGGPQVDAPPGLPTSGIVAVEVEGDSMEPVYSAGDILFYTRATHDGVPDDVIGHRCVVEDSEGNGWVKQVKLGSAPGLFNLISLNPGAMNQHDVRLKWAARVRLAWPADLARRVV